MAWKLLFLLFAVAAAFDEDVPDSYNPECMEKIYSECDLELLSTASEFPDTNEELQEACKSMLDFTDCVTNILNDCKTTEDISTPFYTAQKVFTKLCDKDSELFQIAVESLECLGDNLSYLGQPCALTPKETQDLNDIVNAFSAAEEDAFQNDDLCMESLSRLGCLASKIEEKCGRRTVSGFIEILEDLDNPFERCGPGVKENLPLILGILGAEEELAEDLEEAKKKKR